MSGISAETRPGGLSDELSAHPIEEEAEDEHVHEHEHEHEDEDEDDTALGAGEFGPRLVAEPRPARPKGKTAKQTHFASFGAQIGFFAFRRQAGRVGRRLGQKAKLPNKPIWSKYGLLLI